MGIVGYTDENNIFHKTVSDPAISNDTGQRLTRGSDNKLLVLQDETKADKTEVNAKANQTLVDGMIGTNSQYDNSTVYVEGDYCIHNNELYRCIVATITGQAPPNASYWERVSLVELGEKSRLQKIGEIIGSGSLNYDATKYKYIFIYIYVTNSPNYCGMIGLPTEILNSVSTLSRTIPLNRENTSYTQPTITKNKITQAEANTYRLIAYGM